MGAVMGSKNLKAIAVQGHGKVPVVDEERFLPLRSAANRQLRSDAVSAALRELGSSSAAEYFAYLGEMPSRYFRSNSYSEADKISGSNIKESILSGVSACHACVIACGRVVHLEDGRNRKGPEYETLVGFGPNLLLSDPVFVTRIGELCDRFGVDSISLSNTIGLAFTLFEQGKITLSDTGGISLIWGNSEAVEKLVHQVVNLDGLGKTLAKGALALGREFGAEDEAVVVNRLEVAYHDPRGASGMALVYATSPRGACHNQSDYFLVDIGQVEQSLGMEICSRQGGAEKARSVAVHQNWRTVFNSLVLCIFANVPPEMLVELINAACGLDWDINAMLTSGERGWNIKRLINMRLGLTRRDDRLPKALLTPFSDDPEFKGVVPNIDAMLRAYYQARGWDPHTGFPTRTKLKQLGLDWAYAG
jgi:aldehyde:ferredoxin oxidoreductase